ncbi:acyltransferase family protein [Lachnotalea glycerini]|uniref:Acyltransferase n=1 Tax=Lachnotalea glycerini TaxID=1763509 RepID=A0A371JCS1_9FIRM|nr:acyltransferase family protein [Lachnotalea glycerini]RDY30535.1 acyltransferase [Lachnotalea glycerini]
MKERNISLDAMKGFVILLVMLGHIINLNKLNDPYIYTIIEAVQMPAFIMISGYIGGFRAPVDNFLQWKNIMCKRGKSYVVPFFMWLFLKQWDNLAEGFVNTIFRLDRGLWFLMTLFILNGMLYTAQLLSKGFRNRSKLYAFFGFCMIFCVLSIILVLQLAFHSTFLTPELTLRYIPPFIIGYFVSAYKEELIRLISNRFQFVLFIISAVFFITACWKYHISSDTYFLYVMLIEIAKGLLGCYVIFYLFLKSKKNVIKEKLAWLGKYTLEIYTVHFHFATIFNQGRIDFGLYSWKGILFVIATFCAMSLISAALIYMVKQVPVMNQLMFGKATK